MRMQWSIVDTCNFRFFGEWGSMPLCHWWSRDSNYNWKRWCRCWNMRKYSWCKRWVEVFIPSDPKTGKVFWTDKHLPSLLPSFAAGGWKIVCWIRDEPWLGARIAPDTNWSQKQSTLVMQHWLYVQPWGSRDGGKGHVEVTCARCAYKLALS